jgi:STE24 endopeptidase
MSPELLLKIIIWIVVIEFIFDTFLEYLNSSHQSDTLPAELQDVYEHDKYIKSLAYQKEQTNFGFFNSGLSFVLSICMLAFGGFGYINAVLITYISNPTALSLVFFGVIYFASDIISIPLQLYGTFVIEEKYGFNKMNIGTFIADKFKGYALAIILGGVIIGLLLLLIQWLGPNFWIVFWVFISGFMVIMNMFYTSLIVPIFNKLAPLEDGDLKNSIISYCSKVSFPLDNLFVIDGSKRSAKANAYFSGFGGKKKIVLYDTLIKDHSNEELVAVLAHEVGHYKRKHIIQSMVISVLTVGVTLYLLSLLIFNKDLSIALGATQNTMHLNLIAFGILYSPISTLTGLAMTILSRKNEYEADDFAKNTFGSEALVSALKKLSANNLSNLTPHPLYVFFNYSHPPLLARIRNLKKQD